MLSNIKNRKQKGFTIIEVLIVLAIAGLILLVVFLAVPALQRNSRNTQRRADVGSLLSGVSEFTTNNQGNLPTGASLANNEVTFTGASGTSSVTSAKLGFYKNAPTVTSTIGAAPGVDDVTIISNAKCSGNTPTTTGASARSVVAYYSVEQSGGSVAQCQESGA